MARECVSLCHTAIILIDVKLRQPKVDNDPFAEIVREKLSRIFRKKGAICMDAPTLMPDGLSIYGARNPVRLLDADGTVVVLPFLLNIPFLRMVARDLALTRLKRWTIAPVYRTSPGGGVSPAFVRPISSMLILIPSQQPRAILNAAFDIVSDAVTSATEAEVIYVADEIVAAFPFDGETVHYLNHAKILDALVERVPSKRRALVLDILSQHGRLHRTWSKTSTELLKITGMSKALVDDLGALDIAGTFWLFPRASSSILQHFRQGLLIVVYRQATLPIFEHECWLL